MHSRSIQPVPAVRTEPASGFRDELQFFGPPGSQMLGCRHVPLASSHAGLVLCSSLRAEFETNYRREILLGRSLASTGITVQRFQYLGTGNSDGATEAVTLESMTADTIAATRWLEAGRRLDRVAFMGTRLGASVAASVASSKKTAPLVLWEPVLDPKKYFRELFRSRQMWAAKESAIGDPTESAARQIHRAPVDVLGYPIDLGLYESVQRMSLEDALGSTPRPVLIVQIGGRELRGEYRALSDRLTQSGFDVRVERVEENESWWLEPPGERQEKRVLKTSPAIDATREWLAESFSSKEEHP